MKRKEFIQLGGLATGNIAFSCPNLKVVKETTITVLHTNDQHSQIEPFEPSHKKYGNKGGFSQRALLIDSIRKKQNNVLLLDAGDIFQGTPYFNYFGGELEFKLMSKMKYDASTMGNHDFDNGLEGFKKQLPHAKFDFICSNYDFSNTILEGKTKPYKIIRKDGIKIGIFGLGVELNGLVSLNNYLETQYLNPVEIATDLSNLLKKDKKCDLVIALSHLGYKYENNPDKICDLKLAKQTRNIDLIIGGHTHTFLDKPTSVKNLDDKITLVTQAGWAGIVLGKIDFHFTNQNLSSISWGQIPVNQYV
ncbi:MAG: metallophosphatase [Flavobacteriales bacterium]|nr:metallophosphatase [Flavobacteriales bacterium]